MDFEKAKDAILKKLTAELPPSLAYHSVEHVLDVLRAVEKHIAAQGITGHDAVLLRTAALYHDSGFTVQPEGHEELSCGIAGEMLPQFGYSPEDIDAICGMIMATRIPQSPKTPLEEILADADLDYLGRDDFFEISAKLFKELKSRGLVSNEDQWNKIQLPFFENHRYFTAYAKAERNILKAEHFKILQSKIV
ncbi:MAG: HD domain-containing protein [Bacteroidia bacterium]